MKEALLTLTATLVCAGTLGQGKLTFSVNGDNLIYLTTNAMKLVPADRTATSIWGTLAGNVLFAGPESTIAALSGSPTIMAALYAGASSNSLALQSTTTIGTIGERGLWPGPVATVNCTFASLPAGTPAWFQVQVFDSRANAAAPGGGAADAWAHQNWYAGVSQVFQASPMAVGYTPIWLTASPVNSTWAPGTYPIESFGPGCYGGIEVYANTGPPPPQPQILSQPTNATIQLEQSVTFSVTASGDPPLRYQWQANELSLSDGPHISGSTTNQLTLNMISAADAGGYRVIIANGYGSVTSSVAVLALAGAPSVAQQPVSQVGYWGKSATFTVAATGDPPLNYQWRKDGGPIPGATNTSLVLTNLQATNAGLYTVVVSNLVGSISSQNAYLTIYPSGVSLSFYSAITIEGAVGQIYGIQCSTNLDNPNGWWGVTNLTLARPIEVWLDTQPEAQLRRFYRVASGPIPIP